MVLSFNSYVVLGVIIIYLYGFKSKFQIAQDIAISNTILSAALMGKPIPMNVFSGRPHVKLEVMD